MTSGDQIAFLALCTSPFKSYALRRWGADRDLHLTLPCVFWGQWTFQYSDVHLRTRACDVTSAVLVSRMRSSAINTLRPAGDVSRQDGEKFKSWRSVPIPARGSVRERVCTSLLPLYHTETSLHWLHRLWVLFLSRFFVVSTPGLGIRHGINWSFSPDGGITYHHRTSLLTLNYRRDDCLFCSPLWLNCCPVSSLTVIILYEASHIYFIYIYSFFPPLGSCWLIF